MRVISSILISIAVGIFLVKSLDIKTYQDYHTDTIKNQNFVTTEKQAFLENTEIISSPQKENWLIQKIDGAEKELKIAQYMFTVPSLREALLGAKNRGVDIEIILEKNPYNAVTINNETVQFLKKNRFAFYETDDKYFSFMHAKYMIIDDTWIIATANWTRSSFSSNREFFIIGNDALILADLRNIFETDFSGKKGFSSDTRIIAGPTNARDRLIRFMESTSKNLDLYTPSLTDEDIILELKKICSTGKAVRILLDRNADSALAIGLGDQELCPKIRLMKKPLLHAKAVIIDDNKAFVGSFNFTKNSLENNREVGIFIKEKSISELVNSFQEDWGKSVAF